jgi:murein L,D-transpeptidase YcbB/YkuD
MEPAEPLLRVTVESIRDLGPLAIGDIPLESGRLLSNFYAGRGYRLAWERPEQVAALLQAVDESRADGLDPADYHLLLLRRLSKPDSLVDFSPVQRIAADLQLSDALLRYSYHIRFGRLDPVAVNRVWNHRKPIPVENLIQSMEQVVSAPDTLSALRMLAPQPFFYAKLKQALRVYGGTTESGLDGRSATASSKPQDSQKAELIRMNLERMRWFYDDLPADYVFVDVGGFMAHVVRDGRIDWSTRVIVGTPKAQTPSFRDEMEHVVFNPTWTVPPSIQKKMRGVSSKFKVVDRRTGRPLGAANLSDIQRVSLVQGPGPTNALGRVKFMFPNDHAVYLHDTTSKGLFGQSVRAYSHGCVRVMNPLKLAEVILQHSQWDKGQIDRVVASNKTKYVFLKERLPVLIYYLTAKANDSGQVEFRSDLYGRDAALRAAIKGSPSQLRIRFPAPESVVDPALVAVAQSGPEQREGSDAGPAKSQPRPPEPLNEPVPYTAPAPRPTLTQGPTPGRALNLDLPHATESAPSKPADSANRL